MPRVKVILCDSVLSTYFVFFYKTRKTIQGYILKLIIPQVKGGSHLGILDSKFREFS